jgi:plasmid stabilization system protein ParE
VTFRVNLTNQALADLQRIFSYIAQSSVQNASDMVGAILDSIDTLNAMPRRFKVAGKSRKTGSPVHSLVVRPFLVYYRVQDHPPAVFVLTIRHGARRQPRRFE